MLETVIAILLVLWLLGFFGWRFHPRIPRSTNWVHTVLLIAVFLIILRLLGVV